LLSFLGIPAWSAPAWADGEIRNLRVVDYGADMGSGDLMYRGESPERGIPYDPAMGGDGRHAAGTTFVSAWPLSFDEPLNPPGIRFDTTQKSAVFYGGLVTLTIDNPERGLSEGHLNANHEFRDDCNFMALQGGAFKPGEEIEAYAFWFWKKADFLNGGATRPVSFDGGSRIAVHISRYWGGVHAGRWVVREGDAFFVSEKTFAGRYKQFTFEDKENPITRRTHTLAPGSSKWARWDPKAPCGLAFDHRKADFQPHPFRDVQAVGFLVTRELCPAVKAVPGGLSPNQPVAVKWYAFRCDAVVGDGQPTSTVVPSVAVAGLLAGRTEITFAQWEKVRRIAVTNQYCRDLGDLGYTFQGDGSMGSMRVGDQSHRPDEPVTDITWLDAVAWCNALSEFEGFEPAYFTDREMKTVLRRTFNRDRAESRPPKVYWKSTSPGYRLPTGSEWAAMALPAGKPFESNPGWTASNSGGATRPAETEEPGPQDLCGMSGNVWEYAWPTSGSELDPNTLETVTALGGDFLSPADPQETNPGFGPENPFENGSFNIGFRVVRGPAAPEVPAADGVPSWIIARGQTIPPRATMDGTAMKAFVRSRLDLVSVPGAGLADARDFLDPLAVQERNVNRAKALDDTFLGRAPAPGAAEPGEPESARKPYPLSIGKTEIPFSVWNRVRAWSAEHGYRFNYPGDLGSMRIDTDPAEPFSPDEPVTNISWYDAVAWCNALSDLFGAEPVYFADAAKSSVFRQVSPFRLDTYTGPGYPNPVWKKGLKKGESHDTALNTLVFLCPARSGFRLLLADEFKAAQGGFDAGADEWVAPAAGGRTHPVGTKPAGATGLHDLWGNVLEWGWDPAVSHVNSMVDYRVNGSAYFFEMPEAPKATKAYYKEYTGAARPFVGLRVARGNPE
jgi:formylglycine-generating enzyme required for sulfatase activity